jgi:uncharacterized repeat protein (TIGR02543 family)
MFDKENNGKKKFRTQTITIYLLIIFLSGAFIFLPTVHSNPSVPTLKWSVATGLGECANGPLAADVNADGKMEVIRDGADGLAVYDGATGSLIWKNTISLYSWHVPMEIIDLNLDGIPEILVTEADAGISAFYGNNGTRYWHNYQARARDKQMVAGDINADGYPEVFVCTSGFPGSITALTYDGYIYAQNATGYPCWGGLTLGDPNHDGVFDVYQNDYYAYGVRCWWASNLTLKWKQNISGQISCESHCSTLVDVNNDGIDEVVALNQYRGGRGIAVLNSENGSVMKFKQSISGMSAHSQPTIYDVDNDGNLELISAGDGKGRTGKPYIWDLVAWTLDAVLPYACLEPPAVADIDGDGNVEIICCNPDNITIYNTTYTLITTLPIVHSQAYVVAQDIDDDGLTELIFNADDRVYAYNTVASAPTPRARSEVTYYGQGRGRAPYYQPYGPVAPIVRNENPTNGADYQQRNPTLSVYVYDYQFNTMNITFRTNASTGLWHDIDTETNVSYGTFLTTTTEMNAFGTTYWWSVNITDSTGVTIEKIFIFKTEGKQVLTDPYPAASATDIPLNPLLSIHAVDRLGSSMTLRFMTNASSTLWYQLGNPHTGFNGTYTQQSSGMTNVNTKYWWSVNCTDGVSWTNKTFTYTSCNPSYAAWWNRGWSHRKELRIDHAKVKDNLTDFPVLISLPSNNTLKTYAQADGDDIVFTDINGIKLNHEIELYDPTTGQLIAWVKIPYLSSTINTKFYLYYGNGTCSNQQNRTAVWEANYKGVWHMAGTSITTDSTTNNNTGALIGGPVQTAGRIGYCQLFDGVNAYVNCGSNASLNIFPRITLSLWVKTNGAQPTTYPRLIAKAGTTGGYELYARKSDMRVSQSYYNGSTKTLQSYTMTPLVNTQWYKLDAVVSYAGTTSTVAWYVNGVLDTSYTASATFSGSTAVFKIAEPSAGGGGYRFKGYIDEVRVSDTPRSAQWIATEYLNQQDPSNFIIIFTDETVPPQYTFTINTMGNGSVIITPLKNVYNSSETITITALPKTGWTFDQWSGDHSGSINPDTIIITQNLTITATFTEQTSSYKIRENFDTLTPGATIGTYPGWYDGGTGPIVAPSIGVNDSIGLAPANSSFTWTAHPFNWNDSNLRKVNLQIDVETDSTGTFTDDSVGWMLSDTSTNSHDFFGVQMTPSSPGSIKINGYWDGVNGSDKTPVIIIFPSDAVQPNTFYRLQAEFTKLGGTSVKINVSLTELDVNGYPTQLIAHGVILNTSLLNDESPDSKYFTGPIWPAFKNYNPTDGAADNIYYELITYIPYWSEDFNAYTQGQRLDGTSDDGGWKGWDNVPAKGGTVSNNYSRSSPYSDMIRKQDDNVHEYYGYMLGSFVYTTWQYLPASYNGKTHFILMSTYADGGAKQWALDMKFDSTLNLVTPYQYGSGSLPLIKGQWVELRTVMDTMTHTWMFYYGGQLLCTYTGSNVHGIAAVDLWASGASKVYYDDMSLSPALLLTTNTVGNGTIMKAPDYIGYHYGDVVSLTAVPAAGWSFVGWSGTILAGHEADNPLAITFDANKAVTATFTPQGSSNTPPELAPIGNKSVMANTLLMFTAVATDTDVPPQTLLFSLDAGAPAGASINSTTGVFTWIPTGTQTGSSSITVRVTDDGVPLLNDSETITITISDWSENFSAYTQGQRLDGTPDDRGWKGWDNVPAKGGTVSNNYSRSSPYSDMIRKQDDNVHEYYGYTSNKWVYTAWQFLPASYNGKTHFILMSTYADGGTKQWALDMKFDSTLNLVTPYQYGSGSLPLIKGQWVELRTVMDTTTHTWMFYYSGQLLCTYTGSNVYGIAAVDLWANGAGKVYYDDMSLSPTLMLTTNTVGNGTIMKAPDYIGYHYGDVVSLTAVPAAGWSFVGWSGDLTGTVNPTTITVDANKAVTATFSQVPFNTPPVLTSIGNKLAMASNLLTFTAVATDTDIPPQTLLFSLDAGAPAGASINSTTGVFTWTPTGTQTGSYNITVRVRDNGQPPLNDSETFTITVSNWSDNFDSYTLGQRLDGTPDDRGWKGWDNVPAQGGTISNNFSRTSPYSNMVRKQNDNVHQYFGYTSSKWVYTAWQYLPMAYTGATYFNLLSTYNDGGTKQAELQMKFTSTTNLVTPYQYGNGSLPLIKGQWVQLRTVMDIDTQTWVFYYSGQLLCTYTGSNVYGIAAVDLWANGASKVYYDDMSLSPALTLTTNTIGNGTIMKAPDYIGYQYGDVVSLTATPAVGWSFVGWSGDLSGSANPATITINGNKTITATFTQNL